MPTKAESKFDSQSVQIYAAAYDAAKAEMRASAQMQSASVAVSLEVRA